MYQQKKTTIYSGNIHSDARGQVRFVNDFNFKGVKRFYQIENSPNNPIRAFHGHKKEAKYVYVASGSILLCSVYVDNFENPSKKASIERHILTDKNPQIVYIPPHFVNGIKTLEEDTRVIFYSTSSLEDSIADDYRIPYDYWGTDIWQKF